MFENRSTLNCFAQLLFFRSVKKCWNKVHTTTYARHYNNFQFIKKLTVLYRPICNYPKGIQGLYNAKGDNSD